MVSPHTILRSARLKLARTTQALKKTWSDEEMGDPAYFNDMLAPAIEQIRALDPSKNPEEAIAQWMEFRYIASDLRREYLLNKHLP